MLRRIFYQPHILKQKPEETLLYRFFNAQLENPNKDNWVSSVVGDLITVVIHLELNEIVDLSEEKYKYKYRNKKTNIDFDCLFTRICFFVFQL